VSNNNINTIRHTCGFGNKQKKGKGEPGTEQTRHCGRRGSRRAPCSDRPWRLGRVRRRRRRPGPPRLRCPARRGSPRRRRCRRVRG